MRSSLVWLVSLAVAPLLSQPLWAQDGPAASLNGNVEIISDYTFRGISQTQEELAIQGGMDLSAPHGLYAGVWGSNLNFGEDIGVGRAQAEMDVYGGVAPSLAGFDLDLGFIYYGYPGSQRTFNYGYLELGLGAGRELGPVSAGISAMYSPDFFAGSGKGFYLGGTLSGALPSTPLTLSGSLGHQSIEDNAVFGTPDYMDWAAGLSAAVFGLDLGATYVDTNLSRNECFGGSDLCASRTVFSVGLGL